MEQKVRRDKNIGSNLQRLRNDHKLSQEKLCAALQLLHCDVGRSTYAKYEYGELNVPASVLVALHKLYDCSIDEFFVGLDLEEDDA